MWLTCDCNFFVKLISLIVLISAIILNGIGNLLGVGDIIETEPHSCYTTTVTEETTLTEPSATAPPTTQTTAPTTAPIYTTPVPTTRETTTTEPVTTEPTTQPEKVYLIPQPQVTVFDDICSILVVPPVVEGIEITLAIEPEAQYMDMGNGMQGFIGVTPGETYSITSRGVIDGVEESSKPVVVTVYDPVTPATPVIKSVTHNSITVEYDNRCEYRLISATRGVVSEWSDKTHYENLESDVYHTVTARYKATETHMSSSEETNKASTQVKTLPEPTTAPPATEAPTTSKPATTKPSTTKKTTASTTKAPTTEKGPYLNSATEVAAAIFGGNAGTVGTVIRGIDALADGGYIACGTTESTDGDFAGLYSASSNWKTPFSFVAKFSRAGTVEWVKLFGDSTSSVSINDVAVLGNGNIVAVGTYTQPSVYGEKGGNDAVIITLSSAGVELSENIQSGSGDDFFYCITATPNGYAVGGKTTSHDGDFTGVQDISAIVINFNNDNEVLWKHYFNGSKSSSISGIDADSDGNIFLACVTTATDGQFASFEGLFGSYSDTIVMKYNQAGEFQWSYVIATSGADEFDSIAADGKGGCLVAGNYTLNSIVSPDGTLEGIHNCGDTDALAIRLNKNGDRQWYKIVSGLYDDYITDAVKTDGGFAVTGYTNSSNREFSSIGNKGGTDGFVYFLDVNGTTVKVLSQAGFGDDAALCLAYSSGNRELLVAGSTDSTNGSFADKNTYNGSVGYVGRYKITTRNY